MNAVLTVCECQMVDCYAHGDGGGIWAVNSTVDLRCNRISQCEAVHDGGAVGLRSCTSVVANNVFSENTGFGALFVVYGSASITGCTIADNAGYASGYGSGAAFSYSQIDVSNCIFWGNGDYSDPQIYAYGTPAPVITYCDVQGGWEGLGNLNQDPDLSADYHLYWSSSPCINAGDPAYVPRPAETDIDGEIRKWPRAGRVDIGADEYGSHLLADANCDHAVNVFDIDPFILALMDPEGYGETHPGCDLGTADMDGDGVVNVFDIDLFVETLIAT